MRSLSSLALSLLLFPTPAAAAELAMGLRVGEVTQDSAIVWTRVTRDKQRVVTGYRDPRKQEPRAIEFTPPAVPVAQRQDECVGDEGQVMLVYGPAAGNERTSTDWIAVDAEHDFTHHFRLTGLMPATKYELTVHATHPNADSAAASATGSFTTPATANAWQDVSFGVITGQSWWDLDHSEGYHIYPAMQKLGLNFLVPTGDTVYYDSESPRARTVELARYHWHRMYSLPRHIEFHRRVPGYWEVDDHDSWCDDCWPTKHTPWMLPLTFEQGYATFREQVPIGDQPYRTVRWGKGLQVWMVEGRLFRSPNNAPDGPDKTIWGREQRDWLMRTILESDADFKLLISPTPIVGPDRSNKADNHSNQAFAHEGNLFRNWTAEHTLTNLFVCCGDRHWQYMSIDPATKLREFSCGPASDVHAGGSPGEDPAIQPFHRVQGGFLSVTVAKPDGMPTITFHHHDVHGEVVHEFQATSSSNR